MEHFDAIIVGGSFAGLGVAGRLRGNILLVDRKEIGSGQTSACGTILNMVDNLGCRDSLLQEFNTIILHTARNDITFKLPLPFCTFDYRIFCREMLKKSTARVLKANVLGREGRRVITDKGEFQSECLVDASGWGAALAKDEDKNFAAKDKKNLSFGIETTLDYETENLHFWIIPELVKKGVCWLFPCGKKSRFGVGSYQGATKLNENLSRFLSKFGLSAGSVHGGFFPHRLREPLTEGIFLAGDSAGQCMALSGEGIRQAIYFGQVCGGFIQRVIEKRLTLEQAQKMYRDYVLRYKKAFRIMGVFQSILPNLSGFWLTQALRGISKDMVFRPVMLKYGTMMQVKENRPSPRLLADFPQTPRNAIKLS